MAKRELKIEPRIIRSESELRDMLGNFMPSSESQARKTMMDGFELLRTRLEAEQNLNEIDPDDFGGYMPAPLTMSPSIIALDRFVERSLGGKRDGLSIKWTIHGKTWVFDPWTGKLDAEINS